MSTPNTKRTANGSCHDQAEARRKQTTPQAQLAALDVRLGAGKGATKERAKLVRQMNGSDAIASA